MKISDTGEHQIIRTLTSFLSGGKDVITGPGDDCAVTRFSDDPRHDLLLKSDPVIEGTHFLPTDRPELIGRKAVGRVLSDIAAMGGTPLWCLINIVAPRNTDVKKIIDIYKGAEKMASRFDMKIIGGDLARGASLEFHVFGAGKVRHGRALLRSGAGNGDAILVTGRLGGSIKGRHLSFEPRVNEGRWISDSGLATSMIDLSDGIACDLRHVIDASRCGAVIHAGAIPYSPALKAMPASKALSHALNDGEDYELLFTVRKKNVDIFLERWRRRFKLPCSCIGEMTKKRHVIRCIQEDGRESLITGKGFDHFEDRRP